MGGGVLCHDLDCSCFSRLFPQNQVNHYFHKIDHQRRAQPRYHDCAGLHVPKVGQPFDAVSVLGPTPAAMGTRVLAPASAVDPVTTQSWNYTQNDPLAGRDPIWRRSLNEVLRRWPMGEPVLAPPLFAGTGPLPGLVLPAAATNAAALATHGLSLMQLQAHQFRQSCAGQWFVVFHITGNEGLARKITYLADVLLASVLAKRILVVGRDPSRPYHYWPPNVVMDPVEGYSPWTHWFEPLSSCIPASYMYPKGAQSCTDPALHLTDPTDSLAAECLGIQGPRYSRFTRRRKPVGVRAYAPALHFILRPNARMRSFVQRASGRLGRGPFIATQIRHSDKTIHADRLNIPFENHMKYIHWLGQRHGIRTVFMATDDPLLAKGASEGRATEADIDPNQEDAYGPLLCGPPRSTRRRARIIGSEGYKAWVAPKVAALSATMSQYQWHLVRTFRPAGGHETLFHNKEKAQAFWEGYTGGFLVDLLLATQSTYFVGEANNAVSNLIRRLRVAQYDDIARTNSWFLNDFGYICEDCFTSVFQLPPSNTSSPSNWPMYKQAGCDHADSCLRCKDGVLIHHSL